VGILKLSKELALKTGKEQQKKWKQKHLTLGYLKEGELHQTYQLWFNGLYLCYITVGILQPYVPIYYYKANCRRSYPNRRMGGFCFTFYPNGVVLLGPRFFFSQFYFVYWSNY
jgi:hypothetical protein